MLAVYRTKSRFSDPRQHGITGAQPPLCAFFVGTSRHHHGEHNQIAQALVLRRDVSEQWRVSIGPFPADFSSDGCKRVLPETRFDFGVRLRRLEMSAIGRPRTFQDRGY